MEERKNTIYLLKWLIPWLIFDIIALLLVAIIYTPLTINNSEVICCISYIFVFCLFLGLSIFVGIKKQRRILQPDSAQSSIYSFRNQMAPRLLMRIYDPILSTLIPIWKPSQAYQNALVYSYYGQYDTAREELLKIEWDKFPPFVQSYKKYIEALHVYLEKKDFNLGLDLAKEALRLHRYTSIIPGQKLLYSNYTTLIEIGQLLNGNLDGKIVISLEKKIKRYPVLFKVLIAWALEKAYNQMGKTEQADQMRAYLNQTAPHCIAFAR